MRDIVPRRRYGERRVRQYDMGKSSHLFDRLPKPSCREPVWSAHLEVVRRKFFGNVSSENIDPGFTPDSLREHVIIGAQFFFNVPRERAA
jgi:hypothetical protein